MFLIDDRITRWLVYVVLSTDIDGILMMFAVYVWARESVCICVQLRAKLVRARMRACVF